MKTGRAIVLDAALVPSGQGTAVSFVVVATVFLGLFLLGWRVLARQFRRDASSASSAS
ncbi:DUF3054 family protein [Jiangella asiatica]|uniref:DUF3054 family protein n=1 Tax=Jiangella asiatica TaxID=2530372 RepID=UPI00193D5EFD|nr:DUF3054 family protein [Jiangella asiatica]